MGLIVRDWTSSTYIAELILDTPLGEQVETILENREWMSSVIPTTSLSPTSSAVPPVVAQAQEAFHRDLPELLREHYLEWVAYRGVDRLATGRSKNALYKALLQDGFHRSEILVRLVTSRDAGADRERRRVAGHLRRDGRTSVNAWHHT